MIIEVEMSIDNIITASSPDILVTEGIASCLGMVFYDPNQKKGSLTHIGGVEYSIGPETVIEKVLSEYPDPSKVRVYLFGLYPAHDDTPGEIEDTTKFKIHIKNYLREKGFKKIYERYGTIMDGVIDLELNTKNGRIVKEELDLRSEDP